MKYLIAFALLFSLFAVATEENREEVQSKLQKSIDSIELEIANLKKKVSSSSGQVKQDLNAQVENLEADKNKIKQKMAALKTSGGQAWNDIKAGINAGLEDLKKAFNQAKSRFKETEKESK